MLSTVWVKLPSGSWSSSSPLLDCVWRLLIIGVGEGIARGHVSMTREHNPEGTKQGCQWALQSCESPPSCHPPCWLLGYIQYSAGIKWWRGYLQNVLLLTDKIGKTKYGKKNIIPKSPWEKGSNEATSLDKLQKLVAKERNRGCHRRQVKLPTCSLRLRSNIWRRLWC